jgi:hypothetical protein
MQLQVRDAQGSVQLVAAQSIQIPTDRSGSIATSAVSQQVMAANLLRSGWYIQNTSLDNITVNDIGGDATQANSFILGPGTFFPPPRYPVTTSTVNVAGQIGDTFVAREW